MNTPPDRALEGRKGLVVGIANAHSIAFGCALAFRRLGAEPAVTDLNDKARPHVEPLTQELQAPIFLPCGVQDDALSVALRERWGRLDFALHAVAFAAMPDLQGWLTDSSCEKFLTAMDISCHSVIEVKAAFAGVHVWGKPIGPLKLILPLHASVHDASGRSIVLEFTKEGPKVYDNLPGVLTNAPTFDWHLINVRNFLNLKAMSAGPIRVGASVLSPRRKLGEE